MIGTQKLFLDSGAHSLFNREVRDKNMEYSYYETDAFWQYVDEYAEYLKKNKHLFDVYVSVDVIYNPELTWKVQRYLEDVHKLNPLPVFHGGDLKWLHRYLDNNEYIGIGGLSKLRTKQQWMQEMGDPIFSLICKAPDYLPTHRIHGFAMTSPSLISMYPWYSVDSTSWIQFGKYGIIVIPRNVGGKRLYNVSPHNTFVTSRELRKKDQAHYDNFSGIHKEYFNSYIAEKGFKIGSSIFKTVPDGYSLEAGEHWTDRKIGLVEIVVEEGLCNSHVLRDQLNVMFFLDLEAQLPPYPNPWIKKVKNTRLF